MPGAIRAFVERFGANVASVAGRSSKQTRPQSEASTSTTPKMADGKHVQRLTIRFNCVGSIVIPDVLLLLSPEVFDTNENRSCGKPLRFSTSGQPVMVGVPALGLRQQSQGWNTRTVFSVQYRCRTVAASWPRVHRLCLKYPGCAEVFFDNLMDVITV